MADIADRADIAIELNMAIAMSRISVPTADSGKEFCEECDKPVEPGRVKLGYATCVSCQTEIEHRAAQRRRNV